MKAANDSEKDSIDKDSGGPRAMSRVLRLLDCLAKAPEGLSLSDLSVLLTVPKSTLLNSLKPLATEGFLMAEGNLYRLGPRAFRLAADIGSAWSLPRIVRGFMQQVAAETRESVALAVLDIEMRRFVYIDSIESPQPVRYSTRIGMSGPLYSTAAGRVLLAYQSPEYQEAYVRTAKLTALTPRTNTDPQVLRDQLAAVREQGWWMSSGESVADSAAIAAPVFGPNGEILAALSLGAPSDRLETHRDAYLAALRSSAARASGRGAAD